MRHLSLLLAIVLAPSCGGRSLSQQEPDGGSSGRLDGFWGAEPSATDGSLLHDTSAVKDVLSGKVTITLDKSTAGVNAAVTGTVRNGTLQTIYLGGCGVFNRQMLEQGQWKDRGPSIVCGWEGEAVPVPPGGSHSQQEYFDLPGTWRLALMYGTGCKPKLPLSGAQCTGSGEAFSKNVTVIPDKAACDALSKLFGQHFVAALKCNSLLNTPQCTVMVQSGISCGCPKYVNSDVQLKKDLQKWSDLQCEKIYPPCAIKCVVPKPSSCTNGTCQAVP